jgi:hypothetical protein
VKDFLQSCLLVLVVACTGLGTNEPTAGALSCGMSPPLPPLPPGLKLTAVAPTNEFRVSIRSVPLTNIYVYPRVIDLKPIDVRPELAGRVQREFQFHSPTGNWTAYELEESDWRGGWSPVGGVTFTNVRPTFNTVFGFGMVRSNDNRAVRLKLTGYPKPASTNAAP